MTTIKYMLYLAVVSFLSFLGGRFFSRSKINPDRFPFAPFAWEKNGRFYDSMGIRQWHNKLPDMSRILPFAMPSKKVPAGATVEQLDNMVRETCIAEVVHWFLVPAGLPGLIIWPSGINTFLWLLNSVCNLPFVAAQRYNRPRLQRLRQRLS
jgi:glycosyl-4,4'-diaponeurosporenoate acyltransferase